MTSTSRLTIVLLIAVIAALSVPAFSQTPKQTPQPQAAAEPLGEDEPIPFMRSEQNTASSEPSSAGLLFKTVGAMALIIGLIFVGAWGAKKLGYGNSPSAASGDAPELSVLRSVSLANNRNISAIKFGSRLLLVGSTPQSFTLLAEEPAENDPEHNPRSVAELLAQDDISFSSEFEQASSRLNVLGGRLT